MLTTCPKCRARHDVPDAAVIAHAARIMQRRSRTGTAALVEASRRNGRLGGRPRGVTEIVRDVLDGAPETEIMERNERNGQ